MERVLAAIRAFDRGERGLFAFLQVNESDVMRQAAVADANFRLRRIRLLEGVPVAVKDHLATAGYAPHFGSSYINQGAVVPETDEAVAGVHSRQ
jgi:Asp-tRNA(Asn)/Glu-tRNA(Gln) amidotransferase A subunit family amidase